MGYALQGFQEPKWLLTRCFRRTMQDGKKEKVTEEVQAKEAEREPSRPRWSKRKLRDKVQLGRLAPFPKSLCKLSSFEPATSADASGSINGGRALSHGEACNMMWLDLEGIEDDSSDGASGYPD
jgi:hypothetical protein